MRVFAYWNLHRHCWSLKALEGEFKGRVVAHCRAFELEDCTLQVSEAELARRAADPALARPASPYVRGWAKLYVDTVLQADRGCDQDFLVGSSGDAVSRESH